MEKLPNNLLRHAREERDWSQMRLAEELGVEEQTVRSWERGMRFPSPRFRDHLCKIFERTPEQLGLHRSLGTSTNASSLTAISHDASSLLEKSFHYVDKNRKSMLKRVHSTWIEGVLDHSLHDATPIVLELQEQPDALADPWRLQIQQTSETPQPLPIGTHITEVYDKADGELLILGEPGSGKTTLLLELARNLLDRAERNEEQPIPVVLHLSSWAIRRSSLDAWLLGELHAKYRVPLKIGKEWIEANQLIILLDGLDEVEKTARSACVEAINAYQKIDGFVSIVVCCRREEYFKQETRVALRKAVLIQPLTEKQVETFFSSAGIQLEEAKNAFQEDAELRKIMRTPLMLSIVALAYQGKDQKPSLTGSVEIRTSHIFEFYTRHMLYRAKEDRYKQGKTIRWLSWLAQQMARHNQTEFFLERMQPDWLSDRHAQYQYRNMINRFFFGLAIMIYAGLYACFRGDSVPARPGLFSWVGGGQGNTVLGWMAPGLGAGIQGAASLGLVSLMVQVFVLLLVSVGKLPSLSVKAVWHGLMEGLRVGLSVGIPVGLFSGLILAHSGGLRYGIYRGVGLTIYASLIIGLMNVIRAIVGYNQKKTRKEDKRPINIFDRFINFFLFDACAAFGFGCMYALQEHQIDQLVINYSLIIGFFYGVAFGLANGMNLFQDLGTDIKPAESVIWSWSSAVQNLTENLRQAGILGLVLSGCVILVIGTMSSFFYGIGYGLRYSLVFGILVGFIGSAAAVLATILTNGWKSSIVDEHQLMQPNEGIRRSMNNALFAACIFGPIGGLLSGIIGGVAFGFVGEITGWPILLAGFAILFSIVFAFAFLAFHGGMAFVEHYFLRCYLYRKGYIPWNYARFLDYAVDRILLYKVGGGYIFSHRLLLEYFANVPLEDENE